MSPMARFSILCKMPHWAGTRAGEQALDRESYCRQRGFLEEGIRKRSQPIESATPDEGIFCSYIRPDEVDSETHKSHTSHHGHHDRIETILVDGHPKWERPTESHKSLDLTTRITRSSPWATGPTRSCCRIATSSSRSSTSSRRSRCLSCSTSDHASERGASPPPRRTPRRTAESGAGRGS